MATPRKPLPRHAEYARIDALAATIDAQALAAQAAAAARLGDKVGALVALGELRAVLGVLRLILHQQGDQIYQSD